MKGGPSDGFYSTVEDLVNFDIALRDHILLNSQHTQKILSPKPEFNSSFYGYGFFINDSPVGESLRTEVMERGSVASLKCILIAVTQQLSCRTTMYQLLILLKKLFIK